MKALAVMAVISLLVSCGGETDTTETADGSNIHADSAGTAAPEPEEVEEQEPYSTLEDYSGIATRELLIEEFEQENLEHGESWYAEGTVSFQHSELTDPENGYVIRYLWEEDGNTLNSIEIDYRVFDDDYNVLNTQEVYSECGLYTGMPLEELREWNGGDFDFHGFKWDYEGAVIAEEGSKLFECVPRVELILLDDDARDPYRFQELWGDRRFNTADDAVQGAPIFVGRMYYTPSQ